MAVDLELDQIYFKFSNFSSDLLFRESDYYLSCVSQGKERKWWIFLASSLLCPVVLNVFLGIWMLMKLIVTKSINKVSSRPSSPASGSNDSALPEDLFGKDASKTSKRWELPWAEKVEREASRIILVQSRVGHVLGMLAFFVAMVSFAIYVYEVSDFVPDLEVCRPWVKTLSWQVDMACNVFFLLLFILRFIASSRKKFFLFETYSVVDYFTIPPAFVSMLLDRNWSGLRFMRVLYIFSIPEVMQYVGLLKTRIEMRMAYLICQLLGVVFVGSGMFHLLENFFVVIESGHSYPKFFYFTIITLSTVGYGDIYPVTPLGRAFDCFFIMGALGLFASSIPDIVGMLSARYKYGGAFKKEAGTHHVIVCGHITYSTAHRFLENFFHGNNHTSNLSVVFISHEDPDLEMEALLKRNFTHVEYLQGDVLSSGDLRRAAVKDALACLVIADKKPERSDVEDATNIIRVISIKNAHPAARVIVQIHHSNNKVHLANLPTWSTLRGDAAVGLAELKMGLIGQSCITPGFSTLISNFMQFYPVGDYTLPISDNEETNALDLYLKGCKMQIAFQRFSDYYHGMSFTNAARHCYLYLDLLLIGLFERPLSSASSVGLGGILINPSAATISADYVGIFITASSEDVARAWNFCKDCHVGVTSYTEVKFCGCESRRTDAAILHEQNPIRKFWLNCQRGTTASTFAKHHPSFVKRTANGYERNLRARNNRLAKGAKSLFTEVVVATDFFTPFGPTGKTHWIPARDFHEVVYDPKNDASRHFQEHIIICVFAEPSAGCLDIAQFIVPLRSSGIRPGNLKDILIMGNLLYLEKEWHSLRHFPRIIVVKGNPLDRSDLEAVSIKTCEVCVIISSKTGHSRDEILDDQEVILATLNLKAMDFEESLRDAGLKGVDMEDSVDAQIKVITNLEHDENVQFLEQDQDDNERVVPLFLTEPYISGSVFMDTVLDSLMITTYFNPLSISLINAMVFGSAELQPETGSQERKDTSTDHFSSPVIPRTQLESLPLGEGIFSSFTSGPYKNIVMHGITEGIVCIGISRTILSDTTGTSRRCVIANPHGKTMVRGDDIIFAYTNTSQSSEPKDRNIKMPQTAVRVPGPVKEVIHYIQIGLPQDDSRKNSVHSDHTVPNLDSQKTDSVDRPEDFGRNWSTG